MRIGIRYYRSTVAKVVGGIGEGVLIGLVIARIQSAPHPYLPAALFCGWLGGSLNYLFILIDRARG